MYCVNASTSGSPPVPSCPTNNKACGKWSPCHIFNNPVFAGCCPTTFLKFKGQNSKVKDNSANSIKSKAQQPTNNSPSTIIYFISS
jgi:hypothetical protein